MLPTFPYINSLYDLELKQAGATDRTTATDQHHDPQRIIGRPFKFGRNVAAVNRPERSICISYCRRGWRGRDKEIWPWFHQCTGVWRYLVFSCSRNSTLLLFGTRYWVSDSPSRLNNDLRRKVYAVPPYRDQHITRSYSCFSG